MRGVRLSKQIMQIAGDALKRNISNLGPLVLPSPSSSLLRNMARTAAGAPAAEEARCASLSPASSRRWRPLPDLLDNLVGYKKAGKAAAGGMSRPAGQRTGRRRTPAAARPRHTSTDRGRGEGRSAMRHVLAKELPHLRAQLPEARSSGSARAPAGARSSTRSRTTSRPAAARARASRLSLYRYGNVSSASIWYELELVAEHGNMCGEQRDGGAMPTRRAGGAASRSGDRIWQIAFGSGFKCNSAVWKCARDDD